MARAQQDRRKAAFFHKLCCRWHQARPMDGDSVLILNSAIALKLFAKRQLPRGFHLCTTVGLSQAALGHVRSMRTVKGAPFLSKKRTHVVQRQVATVHGALCAAHLTLDRQHSRTRNHRQHGRTRPRRMQRVIRLATRKMASYTRHTPGAEGNHPRCECLLCKNGLCFLCCYGPFCGTHLQAPLLTKTHVQSDLFSRSSTRRRSRTT